MNDAHALDALSSALHGVLPREPDWMQLIEAANVALVTPNLLRTLVSAGLTIPQDESAFLFLINDRNNDRNANLRSMALDAIAALNAVDVEPVLLKGMAVWATCAPAAKHYPRMMSDVDLLIRPSDAERSLQALLATGFKIARRYPDNTKHVVAELWRAGDVGMLDLHSRPPGRRDYAALFDPLAHTTQAPWRGFARVPTAALQIYLTCLHDMFHDGGFWSGGFDVRHLCDIADLGRAPQSVDWAVLDGLLHAGLLRNAVHSQLFAAEHVAGARIPDTIRRRVVPWLHYRRHRAQYARPNLHLLLVGLGFALEAPNFDVEKTGQSFRARMRWLLRKRAYPNRI